MLLVSIVVGCLLTACAAYNWLLERRRHTAVRRDMAVWDAQWAEEDTRIREEDERFWQAMQELDRRVRT